MMALAHRGDSLRRPRRDPRRCDRQVHCAPGPVVDDRRDLSPMVCGLQASVVGATLRPDRTAGRVVAVPGWRLSVLPARRDRPPRAPARGDLGRPHRPPDLAPIVAPDPRRFDLGGPAPRPPAAVAGSRGLGGAGLAIGPRRRSMPAPGPSRPQAPRGISGGLLAVWGLILRDHATDPVRAHRQRMARRWSRRVVGEDWLDCLSRCAEDRRSVVRSICGRAGARRSL